MSKKAPGKSYRKAISMVELFRRWPDDAAAEAWFVERRWPDGVHCPHCGSCNVQSGTAHKTMPYRCREKECAKRFSAKTGTVMEGSKLGFQVWLIATYLLTTNLKGVSSMKLHRDLNINQRSAWFLAHRLRAALAEQDAPMFAGPAEADETYVGGKRKNMPNQKRKELTGRGTGARPQSQASRTARPTALPRAAWSIPTPPPCNASSATMSSRARPSTPTRPQPTGGMPEYDHEAVNHSAKSMSGKWPIPTAWSRSGLCSNAAIRALSTSSPRSTWTAMSESSPDGTIAAPSTQST